MWFTILYIFNQTLPESTRIHWLSLRIPALGSIHWAVLYDRKIEAHLEIAERFQLITLISCVDLVNQNSMNSEECSRTFPSLVKTQTAVHSLTSFFWWFPQVFYSWRVLCSMTIWSRPAHLYSFSLGKNDINNFLSCGVNPKPRVDRLCDLCMLEDNFMLFISSLLIWVFFVVNSQPDDWAVMLGPNLG
jgi:hypothetical protein